MRIAYWIVTILTAVLLAASGVPDILRIPGDGLFVEFKVDCNYLGP